VDVDGLVALEEHLHTKVIGRGPPIFNEMSACGPVGKIRGGPSGPHATLAAVLIATLICSDEACAEELDLVADDLDALDALDVAACDCGCTLVVLSVSDWSPAELPLLV
jgi:hypothetical protein